MKTYLLIFALSVGCASAQTTWDTIYPLQATPGADGTFIYQGTADANKHLKWSDMVAAMQADLSGKQNTLVSGTSIKTINGTSLLGSGNIVIAGGGGGSGDVTAASAFAADNRIIRSDGTGKGVQASGITISDADAITGIASMTVSGATTISSLVIGATTVTATGAEMNYLSGVTSGIQAQLNGKAGFPDQAGNSGKFLTTNGTVASWGTPAGSGDVTLTGTQTLTNKTLTSPVFVESAIGASAIDWAVATTFTKTLGANTTFTFSNLADGKTINVALTNTASNYTVTWPTVKWSGGTAPTQTVGAKTDIYTFIRIGGVVYGSAVQNF